MSCMTGCFHTTVSLCDPIHENTIWHKIILNKCLPSNTRYSAILNSKPMKFGIQEDKLMLLLDIKFSYLPVQNG